MIVSDALDPCSRSFSTLDTHLSLHPLSILLYACPNEAGMELLFVISAGV